MNKTTRYIILALVVVGIAGSIIYLESLKPEQAPAQEADIAVEENPEQTEEVATIIAEKEQEYERAKELVDPGEFINAEPFTIADLIGKQIIMVDFWTYSCINCQRTTPYLNAWHDKYGDQGLTIIGVHTPEFEFEKDLDNLNKAVEKFEIEYPVVQDNDYKTWRAYKNRYWPRKYIIDIDGFIVYDHIGEGAYEETEKVIQELLEERAERLDEEFMPTMPELEKDPEVNRQSRSPEVYFGAGRNELLANATPKQEGDFQLEKPENFRLDELNLVGDWTITDEYATNNSEDAEIVYRYRAKNVFMVASAEKGSTIQVYQDGALVSEQTVQDDQLYILVEDEEHGEHLLEILVEDPGFKAFTFTFG